MLDSQCLTTVIQRQRAVPSHVGRALNALNLYGVVYLYSLIVQYNVEFDATKIIFPEQPLTFFHFITVSFGTTTHDNYGVEKKRENVR